MSSHIYKMVEIVGSSPESIDAAIRNAVGRAGKSIRDLEWLQVLETRGRIVDGQVAQFQVMLKVGFKLEE